MILRLCGNKLLCKCNNSGDQSPLSMAIAQDYMNSQPTLHTYLKKLNESLLNNTVYYYTLQQNVYIQTKTLQKNSKNDNENRGCYQADSLRFVKIKGWRIVEFGCVMSINYIKQLGLKDDLPL